MIYLPIHAEDFAPGMTEERLALLLGIRPGLPAPGFNITGNLTVDLFDAAGNFLSRQRVHNKIPAAGRNLMRDLLARGIPGSGTGFAPTHMAVGTGITAAADGDIKLVTEVYRAILDSRVAKSAQVDLQLFLQTGDANDNTLTEAALFDSPVTDGGNILARALLATPIVKDVATQAVLTWAINIAST